MACSERNSHWHRTELAPTPNGTRIGGERNSHRRRTPPMAETKCKTAYRPKHYANIMKINGITAVCVRKKSAAYR